MILFNLLQFYVSISLLCIKIENVKKNSIKMFILSTKDDNGFPYKIHSVGNRPEA